MELHLNESQEENEGTSHTHCYKVESRKWGGMKGAVVWVYRCGERWMEWRVESLCGEWRERVGQWRE
jgi:hypothetical protein